MLYEVITEETLWDRLTGQLKNTLNSRRDMVFSRLLGEGRGSPGLYEVLASAINIMQDRITRSRMAGDPPDIIITPRLSHLGLMEFDRAAQAIEEGHQAVRRMRPALESLLRITSYNVCYTKLLRVTSCSGVRPA